MKSTETETSGVQTHKRSWTSSVLVTAPAAFFLAGCATSGANYRPIIDTQNVDYNKYEIDLKQCQSYATQAAGAGQSAVVGAAAGALLGNLLAAAAGRGYNRTASTNVGAVTGAVSGAADGEMSQRSIIRQCLAGRGYRVLS